MSTHPSDASQIVSIRLPIEVMQRLDRYLEWCETHQQRKVTRNAAIREAVSLWLDQQELRAGFLEPAILRQQFYAAYQRLHPQRDGVPIARLRQVLQWPRDRFDAVIEALRAAQQIDLEVLAEPAVDVHVLHDSYQVYGQLYSRIRWRE